MGTTLSGIHMVEKLKRGTIIIIKKIAFGINLTWQVQSMKKVGIKMAKKMVFGLITISTEGPLQKVITIKMN